MGIRNNRTVEYRECTVLNEDDYVHVYSGTSTPPKDMDLIISITKLRKSLIRGGSGSLVKDVPTPISLPNAYPVGTIYAVYIYGDNGVQSVMIKHLISDQSVTGFIATAPLNCDYIYFTVRVN